MAYDVVMRLRTVALIAMFLGLLASVPAAADQAVTLTQDEVSFTLANGSITARIAKRDGTFRLTYGNLPVIDRGYWSQVGRSSAGDIAHFGSRLSSKIWIDPSKNDGERAAVICRFEFDGQSPGLPCDVELRYALGRADRGLYAAAVWEHRPGYSRFSVGEARMAMKLDPALFDFLAIDANRFELLPSGADWDKGQQLNMKEARRITTGPFAGRVEHKYDYSAILADAPAYGWISTKQHMGVWLINPSIEYLAGGPTKVELTGHLDVNPGGAPTLLNMWHGSHYGGSSLVVDQAERWSKFIGPFLIYCNSGSDPQHIWKDALDKAADERKAWPYDWAAGPDYPRDSERGTVTGKLVVSDPLAPKLDVRNMQVGLAAPPYQVGSETVDWQRDSKHYQFWTRADSDGAFTIRHVRPGRYTLHGFADGVLGEFTLGDIVVESGRSRGLRQLTWKPVRYGRQLWEIGIPNRSAEEFRHGDRYWQWGLYYEYPKEFPNDVNFVIGASDWRKDWNYCQPPRIEGNRVQSTTWSIRFDLPSTVRGQATLRLAICGSRGRDGIEVSVNGQPAGATGALPDSGVMHRDGIRGYWCERAVHFDASLLIAGANLIQLKSPARSWVDGVLYDYLRLELDEAAAPTGH